MKVVDRKGLLELPVGTAYLREGFGALEFKGETIGDDWFLVAPFDDIQDRAGDTRHIASEPIVFDEMRDGLFEDDVFFVVLGLDELKHLADFLGAAQSVALSVVQKESGKI